MATVGARMRAAQAKPPPDISEEQVVSMLGGKEMKQTLLQVLADPTDRLSSAAMMQHGGAPVEPPAPAKAPPSIASTSTQRMVTIRCRGAIEGHAIVAQSWRRRERASAPMPPKKKPSGDGDLDAEQCKSLLTDLLAAYDDPAFKKELQRAHEDCTAATMIQKLGGVVLRVQAPVLVKYGLPPTPQGVERMKFAIHRRIAEGALGLQELANKARSVLGLQPIPDLRNKSAEEMLSGMLEGPPQARTIRGASTVAMQLNDRDPQRAQELLDSISQGHRIKAMSSESGSLLLEYLRSRPFLPESVGKCLLHMARAGLPAATLKTIITPNLADDPLRNRLKLKSIPIITSMPTPTDFFKEHVLPSRPCILRGIVNKSNFPPISTFTDFDYLRKRCGHRRVPVKSLAVDDAKGRPVFVSDPEMRMSMDDFLDAVVTSEVTGARCPFYLGKVPLKAELPELESDLNAFASAMPVQTIANECFGQLHKEGVYTYFGCDSQVTPTHFDGFENLLVVISGTKRLWLYPPSDARHLYCAGGQLKEPSRAAAPPFQSYSDLSPDLQKTFAEVEHARPIECNLTPGDFLYLPACWWHCVEGSKERNMILNWWFNVSPYKRMHEGDVEPERERKRYGRSVM